MDHWLSSRKQLPCHHPLLSVWKHTVTSYLHQYGIAFLEEHLPHVPVQKHCLELKNLQHSFFCCVFSCCADALWETGRFVTLFLMANVGTSKLDKWFWNIQKEISFINLSKAQQGNSTWRQFAYSEPVQMDNCQIIATERNLQLPLINWLLWRVITPTVMTVISQCHRSSSKFWANCVQHNNCWYAQQLKPYTHCNISWQFCQRYYVSPMCSSDWTKQGQYAPSRRHQSLTCEKLFDLPDIE